MVIALLAVASCDDPGIKYKVRILTKGKSLAKYGSPYCAYTFESVDGIVLPRYSLVDYCNKYDSLQVLEIEINDLK